MKEMKLLHVPRGLPRDMFSFFRSPLKADEGEQKTPQRERRCQNRKFLPRPGGAHLYCGWFTAIYYRKKSSSSATALLLSKSRSLIKQYFSIRAHHAQGGDYRSGTAEDYSSLKRGDHLTSLKVCLYLRCCKYYSTFKLLVLFLFVDNLLTPLIITPYIALINNNVRPMNTKIFRLKPLL